ncbi:MAG: 30S ribosomal protein S16 [Kineosporiaceae bacterium]
MTTPVAVKIRLKRLGKIRAPYYRIVVADSRVKRDGRVIEEIGKYHPTEDPSFIEVNRDRAQYWLGVGAQPTEQVAAILKVTGDWQLFRGEPGSEGTLRTAAPKADKRAVFEAAAKETHGEAKDGATTPRKKAAKKAAPVAEPAAPEPVEAAVEAPVAETAAPEPVEAAAEAPVAEAAVEAPVAETVEAPAADEGAPGGSETSVQTESAGGTSQAEG